MMSKDKGVFSLVKDVNNDNGWAKNSNMLYFDDVVLCIAYRQPPPALVEYEGRIVEIKATSSATIHMPTFHSNGKHF